MDGGGFYQDEKTLGEKESGRNPFMALLSLGHLCNFHLEKSKGGVGGEIGQAVQLWISVLCTPVACVVLGLCEADEALPGWLTIQ